MKTYKPKRDYKVGMKLYFPYHNSFKEYKITKIERNWYEDNDGDEVYYNCLYLKPTNPNDIDSICEDYNADELMYVETDRDVIFWKESACHSDRDEIIEKAIEFVWDNFYEHPHENNFICSDAFKGMEDFIDKLREAMQQQQ